jgi:hypothetical protein
MVGFSFGILARLFPNFHFEIEFLLFFILKTKVRKKVCQNAKTKNQPHLHSITAPKGQKNISGYINELRSWRNIYHLPLDWDNGFYYPSYF